MINGLLDGKVAIITGAGRGIGAATAHLFAAHGARVVVAELDAEPGMAIAAAIKEDGGDAISIAGDVTKPGTAEQIVERTLATYGSLDIIVNNAGYTWDGVLHKMTDEQWLAMLEIHLTAPFRIIRAAAPYMRDTAKAEIAAQGFATARKIVNVSSTSGTRGNAGQANYASGKAGVIGLTKTLAREWGQLNIQVNACAFGYIETRLTQAKETGEKIERGGKEIALGIPDTMRQISAQFIPTGRAGTPDEAAGAVLFLASPLANYVSGQVLEVTGGW